MELENSFTIPVPPEQAWQALLDVEQIAPCMPGATVDSFDGEVIKGRIKVKVGPVVLTYTGSARFTERDDQDLAVTLEASGKETRGSGTASAKVRSSLRGENGQTRVVVHTTMSVTGRPAQFGRGVMAEVSGKIIERFATNLAAQLAGGGQASTGGGPVNGAVPGTTVPGTPGSAGAAAGGDGAASPTAGGATETGDSPGTGNAHAAGGSPGTGNPPAAAATAEPAPQVLSQPVEDLHLPTRAHHALRREGVHTVGDLSARTEADLLAMDNIGPQSLKEIKRKLAERGLELAPEGAPTAGAPATATGGAATPAAPAASAAPPRAARPPDEDAIDLLQVAGFPVLKRALPAAAALIAVLLVVLGVRRRQRGGRSG